MSSPADHDAYIASAAALPEAEEVVAYGMPGFQLAGQTVAGYAAFSKQCGLYLPSQAVAAHAEALTAAGLKFTKTGITFTPKRPIPDDLVTQLAQTSRTSALKG